MKFLKLRKVKEISKKILFLHIFTIVTIHPQKQLKERELVDSWFELFVIVHIESKVFQGHIQLFLEISQ